MNLISAFTDTEFFLWADIPAAFEAMPSVVRYR